MEWNCQNCKKGIKKGVQCGGCGNREDNWACMAGANILMSRISSSIRA